MKTGYILIDFDVIFPIQSSEFIKSLNFGGNLKKKLQKIPTFLYFSTKNWFFMDKKNWILIRLYSDISGLDLLDDTFKICIPVESYDEETV